VIEDRFRTHGTDESALQFEDVNEDYELIKAMERAVEEQAEAKKARTADLR
jgi:hypothetical protein